MSETTRRSPATEPALPPTTVTFVFTDLEGSTRLLAALRDDYGELLAGYHELRGHWQQPESRRPT